AGEYMQPVFLPSYLPNLLLNGSDGIAVGMATKIPPHNLRELVDALTYTIDHGKPEAAKNTGNEDNSMHELLERATGQGETIIDAGDEDDDVASHILVSDAHSHPKAQFS